MPTIGIVYPGEMGSAIGQLLLNQSDCSVTATVEGRSARSAANCLRIGITPLDTLQDVLHESEVVISVVPPRAALDLAKRIRAEWQPSMQTRIFVDANSISPETMCRIVDVFEGATLEVVDAAIHGQASRLSEHATLYLSGRAAKEVSELFGSAMRTKNLGSEPGRASLQKMLLGSMSKGIIALYCQALQTAKAADMTETFCQELGHFYPETQAFVERSLPTYGQHALRRSEEMEELASTLESFQIDTGLALSIGKMFAELNGRDMNQPAQRTVKPEFP